MGATLHVEVPAHSLELTLAEVHSLRANLPRRHKVSPVALLRACYARLHGVDPATCSHAFSEPDQKAWFNLKRSVDAVLDGKSASAAAQRQQIVLVFDFDAGKFTKRIANAAAPPRPPPPPLAVRLKLQMFVEPEENLTLEELEALDTLEASAKASVRPRRECSTAAADARACDELELEQALADAEAEEGERRRSWELAQQVKALEAQNEELELECLRLEHQRREDEAAAQAAAKAAAAELADAERAAREQLTKQKDRSASALAKMRDQVGEWRGRAANLEEQLYEERRKPDECVRSQNAKALAACAAAEARAAAACAESKRLAKQKDRSARSLAEMRDEVGEWRGRAANLEEQLYEERRKPDARVRSQNAKALAACAAAEARAAAACAESERLEAQLERAKRLRGSAWVQEAERLEAELEEARARAKSAYSLVSALRRNQSAAEVKRLREQVQKSEALAAEAQQLSSRATEAVEVLQEEFEKDAAAAAVVSRRAAKAHSKAHSMALKRVRDAHAEVKELKLDVSLKEARLDAMALELARREVASLRRQAEAEARFDELCARLEAGDKRVLQMQHELQAVLKRAADDAAEAEAKHAAVEAKLATSDAALAAYRAFQAKEGGAYKESVRLCYYSLIDRKVPTNQLEAVVTEVLKMVGVEARALPSRGSAQNMRREMGHVADVMAGVLLAKAQNATGASDDTTKRQRTLAADLVHFKDHDGSLRTLVIGLSCMSSGAAVAKVNRYTEKLAQVQAAARLSVPLHHGDEAIWDRLTLLDLIKNWCSDRAASERCVAKLVEERKAKEARAREGARQLAALRTVGCRVQLSLSVSSGGGVRAAAGVQTNEAQLAELQADARRAVAVTMEAALPPESEKQLVEAEMARRLGSEWWLQLPITKQQSICRVWAATCSAHRWVNVGKGFDEGIKEAFDAIKAERADGAATAAAGKPKAGSPWDQLIYEVTKMLCMNARKMNVAIGQDLLGMQVVELNKDPDACVHTKLKVIIGERFLVTFTNSKVAVALESELIPETERLSTLMETRRVRKATDKQHNRLEASVLEHYKDHDEFDALRVKAIVGHYLLHPLYLSTYHIEHVLELNEYMKWVLKLLDVLILDPTPLLKGDVHALQYFQRALQHEPLLVHALHTPAWGDAAFLRMLKAGLEHARTWTVRHSQEHLPGGALDYDAMSATLAKEAWVELESHPIDNLAAERTLALDCYLTKVLGTRLRVHAREAMVKWSMNVRKAGCGTELVNLSEAERKKMIRDAMKAGRQQLETEHKETARLHEERLPALRAAEQQFRVTEEKKAAVLETFEKMRAEGREVRCVGAIKLLTAKQVQVQLALRHFLDKLSVRRSGKDGELRPLLEAAVTAEVAARAAGGGVEPTVEVETARLKALGFGKKAREGGGQRQQRAPRQPHTARQPRARRPTASDADEGSDASGSDESSSDGSGSDGSSSDEDEDEIDIDELLQKDEDVYEVEKLLEWRQVEGGGKEFLVKWKGYSSKETTWEVEANILEKGMIKAVLKKPAFGQKPKPKPPKKTADKGGKAPAAPPPEPTRARSARSGVGAAAARARQAQESEGEEEEEEEEAVRPPKKPKAPAPAPAPAPKAKRARARPAADSKGKAKAPAKRGPAVVSQDSSDDEGAHKPQCPAPAKPDSSDDEPSGSSENESE